METNVPFLIGMFPMKWSLVACLINIPANNLCKKLEIDHYLYTLYIYVLMMIFNDSFILIFESYSSFGAYILRVSFCTFSRNVSCLRWS
jgi:hypothetical protein